MFSRVTGVTRHMPIVSAFLVALVALILGATAPEGWAKGNAKEEIPFADASIIFETNFTDKDTGIQISLDGEPWQEVEVKGPDGNIVKVKNKGILEEFGLTELFFESNEPNYADLPLAEILALFPTGEYEFEGKAVEGDKLVGEAELTHNLPCGPEVSVDVVGGSDEVTISWTSPVTLTIDPVTETCTEPAEPLVIEGYQVIVENDHSFSIELPHDATSVKVPPEILVSGTYKVEVLAIEESGNQTITETEFEFSP